MSDTQEKQAPEEAGPQVQRTQYYMDPNNLDAEMSKIPLFMSDLPTEENDTLSALQALAFDGSPEGNKSVSILKHVYHFINPSPFSNRGGCKL
jgi:hypothetical protein